MEGIKVQVFASERLLPVDHIKEGTPQGSIFESTLFFFYLHQQHSRCHQLPARYLC